MTLELEALAYKTTALMRLGEWRALQEVVAQTLTQAQQVDDDDVRSYAMAAVALYYFEDGDLVRAAQTLTQCLGAARHAKRRKLDLESQYHGHLGFTYVQLGLYAQARTALEAGLELANLMGIGRYRAYQMLNLGLVFWRTGDLDSAIQMEAAALREYSASSEAFGRAACRTYLGFIHEARGDLVEAAQYLAEARILFAELGVDPDMFEAQATEARVLLALGRSDEARSLTMAVWRYLNEQGTAGLASPAWVYLCVADVLDRTEVGDISVREVTGAGYQELMQRAEKISDPDWRRSFLENVAENRAIIDRWQRLRQGN